MTTETSFAPPPVDYHAAVLRWQQTARAVTHRYLDLYSSAVGRNAALHRDVTDAYVSAIRGFIDV